MLSNTKLKRIGAMTWNQRQRRAAELRLAVEAGERALADLREELAHLDQLAKGRRLVQGWRTCPRGRHPHLWNEETQALLTVPKPPPARTPRVLVCPAHRTAEERRELPEPAYAARGGARP